MGKEQLLFASPVLGERSALAWSKAGLLKVPCRSVASMLRGSLLEIQTEPYCIRTAEGGAQESKP